MAQTSRINNIRLELAKAIAPRNTPTRQREIWPYGDGSYSGYRLTLARRLPELRLDPYGLALAAETSVWANACIQLRKSAVARMPWAIYDESGNALENTPFHAMMRYARLEYQQNLFALWEQSLSVHGEAYLEKLWSNNLIGFAIPGGLRILNSIAVTPQVHGGQVVWYQYQASGGKYRLEVSDLFIHRYTSLTDDFRASAPMITAMDAIGIKRNMQSYMRGFFDNDATPGGLVTPKAGVTVNSNWVTNIMSMWVDAFKGANNRNSTGFIPSEIDYEQFDNKLPEHQQELSDDQIAEICAAFRVPVAMVKSGGVKDPLGGGGKMDSSRAMFYEDFVEPECEDIDTYINDIIMPWLMPNSGARFAFDYDETRSLISDTKERSDKVLSEYRASSISHQEMRIALDYKPDPILQDMYFVEGVGLVPKSELPNLWKYKLLVAPSVYNSEELTGKPLPQPVDPNQVVPDNAGGEPVATGTTALIANGASDSQLPANVPASAKSAAVMLNLGNHPDLIGLQNKTRAYVGDTPVKWSDPASFHVTLASMPTVTDEQMKALQTALEDVDTPEMNLKVGSLNTFDNLDSHAVHFRVRKSVDLLDLQEQIHDLISGLGIPLSSFSTPEAYKPHITMGYADSKPPARTFDSKLTVKPTALHLGVGDEIVYKKPIGDVVTPEPVAKKSEPVTEQPTTPAPVVVSYIDSALDELAQWEKKVKNKGAKSAFVTYLIRDEIADTLRTALTASECDFKAVFSDARKAIGTKVIQATQLDFEGEFDDLLSKALNDETNRHTWSATLRYLLNKYSKLAFADGLTDGGLDSSEMDTEDSDTLAAHLAEQSQYVTSLGDAIYKHDAVSDALAQQKSAMWFNKSVLPAYQAGLLSADQNGLYEWVYGDREHCKDCQTMNGQRHRLKDYARKGIQPKADSLACKGFNCGCNYVKVSGKARGNWLSGAKADGAQPHVHEGEGQHKDAA